MQDLLNDFRVALYSGDFDQAERLAMNQLALLGESPMWLNELGLLYLAQGRMSEALLHFDRAVVADAKFLEAVLNGAAVLSDLGFYDEAMARFEAARTLEQDALREARYPEGTGQLHAGVSARRELAELHIRMAQIYRDLGERARATDELTRALSICEMPHVHMELAKIWLERREPCKALEELELARRQSPRAPEVHVIAAQCYLLLDRKEDAADALARAELLDDRSRTGALLRHSCRGNSSHN